MSPSRSVLVHLCSNDEWRSAQARGEHRPESLDVSGFVHLSTPEQVHLPANRLTPVAPTWCCYASTRHD